MDDRASGKHTHNIIVFVLSLQDFGQNDIWDDSALIKAYDDAVNVIQVIPLW